MLDKSIELLDMDKPKVGKNIIEFISPLIAMDKKKETLDEKMQQRYLKILEIVVHRCKYPEWVTFEDIFENEEEYYFYRNELAQIFFNLACVKPVAQNVMQAIHESFQVVK